MSVRLGAVAVHRTLLVKTAGATGTAEITGWEGQSIALSTAYNFTLSKSCLQPLRCGRVLQMWTRQLAPDRF